MVVLFRQGVEKMISEPDRDLSFFIFFLFPLRAFFQQADGFFIAFLTKRFYNGDICGLSFVIHIKR